MASRPLRPAGRRSPSLARVALQVLMAATSLAPAPAHADASVPGNGDKQPGKPVAPRPKPPVIIEAEPHAVGGAIAQPAPPPPKKKAR